MSIDDAETNAIDERVSSLRHDVLRSALYHTARRRHLEGMGRLLNFIVIIAGAAALADFVPAEILITVKSILASVTLFAGTLQLVYDYSGQARTHEFLQRRFYEILSEVESHKAVSDEMLRKWRGKMTSIYADEPPILRALDAVAYNEASDSLGGKWRLKVGFLQTLTRQYWAWGQASFDWDRVKYPENDLV